jgi:hypothetical protein
MWQRERKGKSIYYNIVYGTYHTSIHRWEEWAESANYTHADEAAPSHGLGNNELIYVCKTMTGGGGQHHEIVVCKQYILYYIIHADTHI